MPQPPAASASPTEHADWLELTALTAPDRESSGQDLTRAVKRVGSTDALGDAEGLGDDEPLDEPVELEDDALEGIVDAAFEQLALREDYLGDDYPFVVNEVLEAKPGAKDSMYVFLVTVTSLGWRRNEDAPENVASLFERVSADALVCYLGGPRTARAYHFGFPRRSGPKAFHDAVEELCRQMGEGRGCRVPRSETAHVKDAKLDLVVWVPFGDGRTNQLSVFGQCAAGANWRDKVNELQPIEFCKRWLSEQPATDPSLAFFVPRHIDERHWPEAAVSDRRILFDRLRITRLLRDMDADLAGRCASWTESALAQL